MDCLLANLDHGSPENPEAHIRSSSGSAPTASSSTRQSRCCRIVLQYINHIDRENRGKTRNQMSLLPDPKNGSCHGN